MTHLLTLSFILFWFLPSPARAVWREEFNPNPQPQLHSLPDESQLLVQVRSFYEEENEGRYTYTKFLKVKKDGSVDDGFNHGVPLLIAGRVADLKIAPNGHIIFVTTKNSQTNNKTIGDDSVTLAELDPTGALGRTKIVARELFRDFLNEYPNLKFWGSFSKIHVDNDGRLLFASYFSEVLGMDTGDQLKNFVAVIGFDRHWQLEHQSWLHLRAQEGARTRKFNFDLRLAGFVVTDAGDVLLDAFIAAAKINLKISAAEDVKFDLHLPIVRDSQGTWQLRPRQDLQSSRKESPLDNLFFRAFPIVFSVTKKILLFSDEDVNGFHLYDSKISGSKVSHLRLVTEFTPFAVDRVELSALLGRSIILKEEADGGFRLTWNLAARSLKQFNPYVLEFRSVQFNKFGKVIDPLTTMDYSIPRAYSWLTDDIFGERLDFEAGSSCGSSWNPG